MNGSRQDQTDIAARYIRENFQPQDRLAAVLLNKRTNSVIQRIGTAEKIAGPDFQAWLRNHNNKRYEVYLSMNALSEEAKGRTKAAIVTIRHVYLDFDKDGTAAVENLLKREDIPRPNYIINSSPDKWQVVWKVEGFGKAQAEELQKGLVIETGADPAATDCTRVLRLPGFYNHKYGKPHMIRVEAITPETYRPEHFPAFPADDRRDRHQNAARPVGRSARTEAHSQSERDWAYAKRALARGDNPALVAAAIASYRRHDKHNPEYYGELTVKKAAEALKTIEMPPEPERI